MSDRDEDEVGAWRIKCAGDKFDAWRDDPSFKAVVTLGRIVNALSFAAYAMMPVQDSDTPSASRQRMNAFMYIGATLFEAVDFLDRCRAELERYDHFRAALAVLIDRPDVRELLDKRLRPLRNRAVFHFDPTFVPRTPGAETDGYYVFVTGQTYKSGEAYYDLADRSVMNSVIGVGPSHAEFNERSKDLMMRTSRLMNEFMNAANEVINEALTHADWEPEIFPAGETGGSGAPSA